ncbi:MAG: glycosyltransferase [Candidatus Omnitrophota bacterium]
MKKLLMLSYDWIPSGSVGVIRIARFAKYLTRAGYGVRVVARDAAGEGRGRLDIDEPALNRIRADRIAPVTGYLSDAIRDRINPQYVAGWYRAVKKRLNAVMDAEEFDVIISSSPPESVHALARDIGKASGKPWIADMRDLWSRDHYRNFGFFRRCFESAAEWGALKYADRIVTVSEDWARILSRRYGNKVRVVTNGYDEEYLPAAGHGPEGPFVVSYLGKMNGRYQDVACFLAAVKALIDNREIEPAFFKADFYVSGYGKPDIRQMADTAGLSGIVHEHDPVRFREALGIMRRSGLLLIVGWNGPHAEGWRPQKVYEYFGARRPILLVNGSGNSELCGMVSSCGIGDIAADTDTIRIAIKRSYDNYRSGKDIAGRVNEGYISRYRASAVTDRLISVIKELGA